MSVPISKMDKTFIRKGKIEEQGNDFEFWQSQPYEVRIATVEQIREEYNTWKNGSHKDFREFIALLNENNVRYLIVGDYAVGFHGYPRYTKDLDVWIEISDENAENIVKALNQFGFGEIGFKPEDFLSTDEFTQLGYSPDRIDIITSCEGVDFMNCYANKLQIEIDGLKIDFIDYENLLKNKQTVGRPQDLADVSNLKSN